METSASIVIDRPPAVVFDFVADMANNPQWQKGQRSCEWTSPPPIGVGSTYEQVASFLGKTIVSSFEVTEYEPGEHIRIATVGGTMPIDVSRRVAPHAGGGCEVSAVVRGDAPFPMKLLGPLLPLMVRSSVRKDYGRLKRLLES